MRLHRWTSKLTVISLCMFTLLLASCDTGSFGSLPPTPVPTPPQVQPPVPTTTQAPVKGSFVGQVMGKSQNINIETGTNTLYKTDLLIGFVTDGKKILGCLTDGRLGHLSVFLWFTGQVTNNTALLQSVSGEHMNVTVAPDAITGTMQMSQEQDTDPVNMYPLSFQAFLVPAKDSAGVYRAKVSIDSQNYIAGWVVQSNDEQRGAAVVVPSPNLIVQVKPIVPGSSRTLIHGQTTSLEHIQPAGNLDSLVS